MPFFVQLPALAEQESEVQYINIINGHATIAQRQLRRAGYAGYEAETTAAACAYLEELHEAYRSTPSTPTPCLFDVGANGGHYTLLCKGLFPATRVVAFEPTPNTAAWLRRIIRVNGMDVRVEQCAVSDREQEVTLYLSAKSDSSNSLDPNFRDHAGTVQVKCIALDDFCRVNRVHPNLLKIDAETHELEVLDGARQVLSTVRPTILLEVLEAGADSTARISALLKGLEYSFYPLDPELLCEAEPNLVARKDARNWMLSPKPLAPNFASRARGWLTRLAACTATTHLSGASLFDKGMELLRSGQTGLCQTLFLEAARFGTFEAYYQLGRLAENERRYDDSFKFYRRGAEVDQISCLRGVARAYEKGRGVLADVDAARQWYARAATCGDERAVAELERLDSEGT